MKRAITTFGYCRVSTDHQTNQNQQMAILKYCNGQGLKVDRWVEVTMSSRRDTHQRRIDEMMDILQDGDIIVVSELSRLARSLVELLTIVEQIRNKGTRLICIKENLDLSPDADMPIHAKITLQVFGMLAEVSRDLLSLRTREGLHRAMKDGAKPGRPKGSIGKSKLDPYHDAISHMLGLGMSKVTIARVCGACSITVTNYIRRRKIKPHPNPVNPFLEGLPKPQGKPESGVAVNKA